MTRLVAISALTALGTMVSGPHFIGPCTQASGLDMVLSAALYIAAGIALGRRLI